MSSRFATAYLSALLACASALGAEQATLSGVVQDSGGQPVAGATVMVYYAGVKKGYSTYCPGCYIDCGKRSSTDAEGAFSIRRLDPELWFELLVVRQGYAPLLQKADPAKGPVTLALSRRATPDDPSCLVLGQVVDAHGRPVADAVIESEFVWFKDQNGQVSGSGGSVEGLDPISVSDAKGNFEIAYKKPAIKMTLKVDARGMSPRRFEDLPTGSERHRLVVTEGASVRGRLVQNGKGVRGAEMGLVSNTRDFGHFFSEVRIGTEADGSFSFASIPAPGGWYVYAKMESVVGRGATEPVEFATSRDGERIDLGKIEIKPGHRLRGQVILTNGKSIPEGMRIFAGTERAWDSQMVLLPPDGRFEFTNLPTDNYSINPAVKGYRFSPKNPNLSWSVEGFIDRDVDDLVILLDPGKDDFRGRSAGRFANQPFRSAPRP